MTFMTTSSLRKQSRGGADPLSNTGEAAALNSAREDNSATALLQDIPLGVDHAEHNNNNNTSTDASDDRLLLRIKSSNDVQIYARPSDRIAVVKRAVLRALGKSTTSRSDDDDDDDDDTTTSKTNNTPYVRLIAAGRLLAPDSAAVQDFSLRSGQVVHAVIAHRRGAQAAAAAPVTGARALRGTGINHAGFAVRRAANEDDDDEEEDDQESEPDVDLEQGAGAGTSSNRNSSATSSTRHRLAAGRRLGFDRLRDTAGLRRSEVAAIRAYFFPQVERWIQQHPTEAAQAAGSETDLVRRRMLQEEAWMQSQGPASEFRLNLGSSLSALHGGMANAENLRAQEMILWRSGGMSASVGTDRDFVWGFMLGFFVGFLMLLWVWVPTVPHKQKLGILVGISVQLALGLWQNADGNGEATDDLVLVD